ncbi:MAG: hypothetical protein Ct9H300mP12_15030 [Acidimicrobiales bacterium]|nr:MAG: hypothetical protein Ct9H300mP12_15030 [Acidimicrobiales bacterium]
MVTGPPPGTYPVGDGSWKLHWSGSASIRQVFGWSMSVLDRGFHRLRPSVWGGFGSRCRRGTWATPSSACFDPKVSVHERTNVRGIDGSSIGAPFDLLVADLSFISLRTVLADLVGMVGDGSPMILLVKPQFEAGRPRWIEVVG